MADYVYNAVEQHIFYQDNRFYCVFKVFSASKCWRLSRININEIYLFNRPQTFAILFCPNHVITTRDGRESREFCHRDSLEYLSLIVGKQVIKTHSHDLQIRVGFSIQINHATHLLHILQLVLYLVQNDSY